MSTQKEEEEEENNLDFSNCSFDDDVFLVTSGSDNQSSHQESEYQSMNFQELTSCLEKIQNTDETMNLNNADLDLFSNYHEAKDIDIENLINNTDYTQEEFVPFEYIKKFLGDQFNPITDDGIRVEYLNQGVL